MPPLTLIALMLLSAPPTEPAPPPPLPRGFDAAPWEALFVEDCKARLEEAGVTKYRFLPQSRPRVLKGYRWRGVQYPDMACYTPQALLYQRGPGDIRYSGYPKMSCAMALAMAKFEAIAQEESERVFGEGKTIKYIVQYGTNNCRRLRLRPEAQSQHSFGNAIDVASFVIKGYGIVDLKKHWHSTRPWHAKRREFLRRLAERLRAERVFTNVLDPEYDAGHANHYHLDLAPPKRPGRWFEDPRDPEKILMAEPGAGG